MTPRLPAEPTLAELAEPGAAEDLSSLSPLAGRYRLQRRIGSGGGGTVFLATDQVDGSLVAVKRMHAPSDGARARVRREVAALRLLDLPGVLRLLDEGVDEHGPFLVTEYVEGQPFPGTDEQPVAWDRLRGPLASLLEVLARVHEAGVVHRDIKPPNVLVRPDGMPVLLDFGLARGEAVGTTITVGGTILGTPRYLAPEQLLGHPVDARADLYAVGVMAFELLTGRPPHWGDSVDLLWQSKLSQDPPPLWQVCPDVPRHIGDLVSQMLARRPDDRPDSAVHCLERLGAGGRSGEPALPWLGDTTRLDAALASLEAGRPVGVSGRPGSGRTRFLRELEARLAGRRRVLWALPGQRPFESLGGVVGELDAEQTAAPMAHRLAVEAALRDGAVLLADDGWAMDRWTRQLLGELDGRVCRVVSVGDPGGRATHIELAPLAEADLVGLFEGPELLLHLPSDGAAELHRRTEGVPGRVMAVLGDWQRVGLCRLSAGGVAMGREALDRLRAGLQVGAAGARGVGLPRDLDPELRRLLGWAQLAGSQANPTLLARVAARPRWQVDLELEELRQQGLITLDSGGHVVAAAVGDLLADWPRVRRDEAHRSIARALEPGTPGRLYHLLAGGVVDDVVDEAVAVAREHRGRGQLGEAEAALCEALQCVRQAGRTEGELPLLRQLARTALSADSARALERARYELRRAHPSAADADELARIHALLEAAIGTGHLPEGEALARLSALAPFEDPDLELGRQLARMQASGRASLEAGEQVLDELATWTGTLSGADLQARHYGWEGRLRYRQGRYGDAARLHEASAQAHGQLLARVSQMHNAATAWLAAGELARARACAERARDDARDARFPLGEARATWALRLAGLRAGELLEPWPELLDAVALIRNDEVEGSVAIVEAAFAFRRGERAPAAAFAARALAAHRRAGIAEAGLHARAMLAALGVEDEVPPDALVEGALACRLVEVGAECLGLLADAPVDPGRLRAAAEQLRPRLDPRRLDHRMCVYTPAEALRRAATRSA